MIRHGNEPNAVVADLVDCLTDGRPEPFADTARAVADTIESCNQGLDAAMKWKQVTYATQGDFHHWICAIGVTRNAITLTFHFGGLLDDPDGLLIAGSSRFLRKLEYASPSEVDAEVVCDFLAQALDRYGYFRDHWRELR